MSIKKCKEVDNRNNIVSLAVANLILVSFVGGILMLTIKDNDFELIDKEEKKEKESKKIKESLKTDEETKKDLTVDKKAKQKSDFKFTFIWLIFIGVIFMIAGVLFMVFAQTNYDLFNLTYVGNAFLALGFIFLVIAIIVLEKYQKLK